MMNRFASARRSARGFSLVEMIVVIAIIVVLAGFLIPAVMRSMRQGNSLRAQGDMQAIVAALEAYKQDFGDIPRLPLESGGSISLTNVGAATLGKALLGPMGSDPAEAFSANKDYLPGSWVLDSAKSYVSVRENTADPAISPTSDTNRAYWALFNGNDGHNGAGFKVRAGATKVWGPYVDPGKMKNNGLALLDPSGNPVLYFPARLGRTNVNTGAYAGRGMGFLYNLDDNFEPFRRLPAEAGPANDQFVERRILIMLGDYNCNKQIDVPAGTPAETAIVLPYLLWSAGPDGAFGPLDYTVDATEAGENARRVSKADDVTNFKQ